MKRLVSLPLFLILIINSFLQSEIYEIHHFEEIYKHLQPETLVVAETIMQGSSVDRTSP